MAYIAIRTSTSNSVTVYLADLDENWGRGERKAYWYIGDEKGRLPTENSYLQTYFERIQDHQVEGKDITFTGLQPNTEYGVYCVIYHDSAVLKEVYGYVKTSVEGGGGGGSGGTTIERWKWNASNGTASAEVTNKALTAVAFNGATTNFSYLVWNDMVNKVYEIIKATTNWWDSEYATYASTKMTESNKTLTADRFNSLRNNLELVCNYLGLSKTGIGKVNSGDTVYGDYFTTLADTMNSCINNL